MKLPSKAVDMAYCVAWEDMIVVGTRALNFSPAKPRFRLQDFSLCSQSSQ
jgi:hypothetical protein